ncbi:hypothetical protein GCM10010185_50160 [Saccharothrix coeruleofusca]|uniref:Uncharacterized protein n=1 Tax=Saccharothrix coeruleofusca TaxID=33919 RepID=A0A918EF30_9PSEU|nr:hypothetical protein GCM10010185_50160 [Saccharothrix coeruleofusca]
MHVTPVVRLSTGIAGPITRALPGSPGGHVEHVLLGYGVTVVCAVYVVARSRATGSARWWCCRAGRDRGELDAAAEGAVEDAEDLLAQAARTTTAASWPSCATEGGA